MQDDTTKKPTVEDQELADMIASMNGAQPGGGTPPPVAPLPKPGPAPLPPAAPAPGPLPMPSAPVAPPVSTLPPLPKQPPVPGPTPAPVPAPAEPTLDVPKVAPSLSGNLDVIKKNALDELRPLVGRLDLPADEKFDTLLLLIRSTDDRSLVKPAYEAASQIADDTRRAEALLDIIKEIDFFENPS